MSSLLTPKQTIVFDFITKYTAKNRYAPSLREIASHIHKSLSSAQHLVEELKNKGVIQKEEKVARGLIPISNKVTNIFKLGIIAAGSPIEPIENPELIEVPSSMINTPGNYYALQVKGDSMIEDNILDGDTIVVRHQQNALNGDRIVAITENGATLKIFKKNKSIVYLEPRNPHYPNIYPKHLEIRGKFVGLIRK